MSTKDFVDQILSGKLHESKESFTQLISSIVKEKIEEKKEEVAKKFFNK